MTLQVLGFLLLGASYALIFMQEAVIRNVTSRSLGSLAPGFAATPRGFGAYALLVGDIGLVLMAIGFQVVWMILVSITLFLIGSVFVLAGEVTTYRKLKR